MIADRKIDLAYARICTLLGYDPKIIDIKANKTILVSVGGKDASGKSVGHACVAFGYRITTDGAKYLQVANGWDTSCNRYLKFKPSELTRFDGYAVSIT